MQVSEPNNVKIYNLSAGKSIPEWLSERKRRALQKQDVAYRKRIELIQDFDMPGVSTNIRISNDGQYILATGIYKPRIKCFDVNNLSMKFERCFDSEAVTFEALSDDYSKLVFLQCDRYIEFHSAKGYLHRLRMPKFGRDMKYNYPSCDLIVVGASSEIYRLNLEIGQFLTPFTTNACAINKVAINDFHQLIVCGTQEGKVDAWDPRSKTQVGSLDVALECISQNHSLNDIPSISALKFHEAKTLGVGTTTGQILLYDIRFNKPLIVKDHMYENPIKDIAFHHQDNLIFSMDQTILKIWNKIDGKLFTSIEAATEFNNLCTVPKSGMFFIATENTKIQTYYIPSLGQAPRWAGFLDTLIEELEENYSDEVYDDYKFVTVQELNALGLEHLIGTDMLRAYMHGYFMNVRLYKKAKSETNPFEFEAYRKRKVREIIESDRPNHVQVQQLPKVNKDFALKLMQDQSVKNKKRKLQADNLLGDDRFKLMFENPDFEVDTNTDEYRLLKPVLTQLSKPTTTNETKKKYVIGDIFVPCNVGDDTNNGVGSQYQDDELSSAGEDDEDANESLDDAHKDDSSDDDIQWTKEMKTQHRLIRREHKQQEMREEQEQNIKMFELRQGEEFKGVQQLMQKTTKSSLGDRLKSENTTVRLVGSLGSREMTFTTKNHRKGYQKRQFETKRHQEERRKVARSASNLFRSTKRPHKKW